LASHLNEIRLTSFIIDVPNLREFAQSVEVKVSGYNPVPDGWVSNGTIGDF
jgi:hypothetical protein